ncbi:hypothetical protein Tmar_1554 [Thermaerobacter marianensis DSM 12885]|uniref:Cytoplasmic protein n=1 Tax=Thermaerobacter marianensis (strain ATCC 700841 / DSM 12885 / JCM 10246 / 7p75a) TaxID=644966 RepID=E6SGS9_THEM7|nr:DUF4312 family protein [Thermaerobacter marianensis]ADU51663.1 hypothetical protein Tmar_1554 [Thermaerobacter marianensis DSM 12885]
MSQRCSRFHCELVRTSLSGTGETTEEALNQILARLRRQVLQRVRGTVLFMAPVHVEVTRLDIRSYTERFLWLFWPRTRHRVDMEVQIDVEVRWLEILG